MTDLAGVQETHRLQTVFPQHQAGFDGVHLGERTLDAFLCRQDAIDILLGKHRRRSTPTP